MGAPVPRRVGRVLPHVGALVEGPAAYGHLSGRANLELLDAAGPGGAAAHPARRAIGEALDRVGLAGVDSRPVKAYSLGMRQRLGLAARAAARPACSSWTSRPTAWTRRASGRSATCCIELNAAGTTVLLSSHLLAEVEQLCTRVGVMDRGRLVLQSDVDELRAPTGRVVVVTPDADRAVGAARRAGRGAGRATG